MKQSTLCQKLYDSMKDMRAVEIGAELDITRGHDQRPYVTPTERWLQNPHIVRAMRVSGVAEAEITGNGADFEKLLALLKCLPKAAGSTLAFDLAADLAALGVKHALTLENAPLIWQEATERLAKGDVTPRSLLEKNRSAFIMVEATSAEQISLFDDKLMPLLSFDGLCHVEAPMFSAYVADLGRSVGVTIRDLPSMERAVLAVLDRFAALGARAVTLDLSGFDRFEKPDPYHAAAVLTRAIDGEVLAAAERALWRVQILRTLGRGMAKHGMRFVFRVHPKTDHVMGDFSTKALEKCLSYLAHWGALRPTLLSLAAGELPRGLALLLDRFRGENGEPLLYFGIEGAGRTTGELSRSLQFYLRHGAASLLLGVTDSEKGSFCAPAKIRFARVLATSLARFAANDGKGLAEESDLFWLAGEVLVGQAVRFFGLD